MKVYGIIEGTTSFHDLFINDKIYSSYSEARKALIEKVNEENDKFPKWDGNGHPEEFYYPFYVEKSKDVFETDIDCIALKEFDFL